MRKTACCFWFVACGLLTAGLLLAEPVDLKKVKVDGKIHNQSGAPAILLRILPEKLFVQQGEGVHCGIEVAATGEKPVTAILKVWMERDMDERSGEKTETLTLPPGEIKKVVLDWKPDQIKPFGHAVCAELSVDGKTVAQGQEFFTSSDLLWKVGLCGSHPVGFTAEHVKTEADLERALENYRANYMNSFEKFFWAPDDFGDMTPEAETYYSGQARYHEKTPFLKHLCDYGNRIGVLPFTYGKSVGSGSAARDLIRKKPEMVYGYGETMEFFPDTEELEKWQKDSPKYWQSCLWSQYNMNDPSVVQFGIDEIIRSAKMFGWKGVRFDGHFAARAGKVRVNGEPVEFSRDQADRQTALNMRTLKEKASKEIPGFFFGYNYAECGFAKKLFENPRETIELCRDGGHIMDEYSNQNQGINHPYRNWRDFAAMILEESIEVRRLGGYLYPIVNGNSLCSRYRHIFTLVSGAHPDMMTAGSNFYGAFSTRYGRFLWDDALEYIWHPNGLVIIEPTVLWENYVRELPVDENHKLLIVHLINPPVQETATETAAAEMELQKRAKAREAIRKTAAEKKMEPDYTPVDSLPPVQLAPEPKKNISVRVVPQAMKFAWEIRKAILLNPETVERTELSIDRSDSYFVSVTVPELKLWNVVIFELERKAK